MKRLLSLFVLLAAPVLSPIALAQEPLEAPVAAVVRDAGGRLLRISGAPGAFHATEAAAEEPEFTQPGWRPEIEDGRLFLLNETSRERFLLPHAEAVLSLSVNDPPNPEVPLTTSYQFPLTAAGDSYEVRLRLRNTGAAAVEVNRVFLDVINTPFTISNVFPYPRTFTPGSFAEIRITFAPKTAGSFSNRLVVNNTIWQITASSTAEPSLERFDSGSWKAVPNASTIDLGQTLPNTETEAWFRLSPPSTTPPALSGNGFSLALFGEGFRINFRPTAPGTYAGKLAIGARSWDLRGTAPNPALPAPILSLSSADLSNGQQVRVTINLASTAQSDATGTLRLEFIPERASLGDDAAVAFVPSNSRSISFSVRTGFATTLFSGQPDAVFQTGSTAGTLVVRATLQSHIEERRFTIAPAAIKLDAVTAAMAPNLAEIIIRGIDNTRSAGRVSFRFYLVSSPSSPVAAFDSDLAQPFRTYYTANPQMGGVFQLRAQFPVTGDSRQIDSIEVVLDNESGSRTTGRLRF